jgi:hypothetical protein
MKQRTAQSGGPNDETPDSQIRPKTRIAFEASMGVGVVSIDSLGWKMGWGIGAGAALTCIRPIFQGEVAEWSKAAPC